MINQRKLFLFVLGFVLACSIVSLSNFVSSQSPDFGTFDVSQNITLSQYCDCTFVNITSITFKGNLLSYSFPVALNRNGFIFNKTFNKVNDVGTYEVIGMGNPSGIPTPFKGTFEVIRSKSNLLYIDYSKPFYIVLLVCILIFCLYLFIVGRFLPLSLVLILIGVSFSVSGVNIIFSYLFVVGGVLTAFFIK